MMTNESVGRTKITKGALLFFSRRTFVHRRGHHECRRGRPNSGLAGPTDQF
jgi:hypothetical protein